MKSERSDHYLRIESLSSLPRTDVSFFLFSLDFVVNFIDILADFASHSLPSFDKVQFIRLLLHQVEGLKLFLVVACRRIIERMVLPDVRLLQVEKPLLYLMDNF